MIGGGAGLLLLLAGTVLRAPGLVAVGVVVELVWLLRSLWTRFGLRRLTYERHLDATRAVIGEEIGLELVVRNRKLLPLPWLQVEDLLTIDAAIANRRLGASEVPGFGILRTTWTVSWFQRVTRRFRIVADRRGIYDFRSVQMQVADLFGEGIPGDERPLPLRYRVVPRTVPVRADSPMSQLPGPARARRGLHEEPTLFAGVRPYQPGDPPRRVHWKATARLGRPVSRRYDPGQERELVIALDAQTVAGPFWVMSYEEDLIEGLCTAALSLGRSLIGGGVACGLAANGYSLRPGRGVFLAPSAAPAQVVRLADELAALSRWASLPFATLLDELGRRLPPSTSLLALTSQAHNDVLPVLRRMLATGRQVRLMALGPDAATAVARARAVGVRADEAQLAPDWRTADALDLVS
ncbi:MAG: DUF58 domain-containing protein [Candidatus Limnocylindria bacterium]